MNSLEGWGSFIFYENGMSWLGSFSWSVVPEVKNDEPFEIRRNRKVKEEIAVDPS